MYEFLRTTMIESTLDSQKTASEENTRIENANGK